MKIRKLSLKKIPVLPVSALLFYTGTVFLWKNEYIPNPVSILLYLEDLYTSLGLTGLFIASFLEGIVYLGLYFPGSIIITLAVILSDGTSKSLFLISVVVAIALTITSIINYILGSIITAKRINTDMPKKKRPIFAKNLLFAMLHPNILAFYFFNLGLKKQGFLKIFFVPLIILPYGFLLAHILYALKEPLNSIIETPYIMIPLILFWIILSFLLDRKNNSTSMI